MEHILVKLVEDCYGIGPKLTKGFVIGEEYEEKGSYGVIRYGCLGTNCNFIVKIIDADTDIPYEGCYSHRDVTINEMVITKYLADMLIAPEIYDMALGSDEGILIMEKYDGTLSDVLFNYQNNRNIDIDFYINKVIELTKQMHKEGIIHRDLNTNNIVYKNDGSVRFIDFGLSCFSNDPRLRNIDIISINGIINIKNNILNGVIFPDKEELMLSGLGETIPLNVLWNNIICPDWG